MVKKLTNIKYLNRDNVRKILKEVADIARVNPDNIDYDRVLDRICLLVIHQITKEKIIKTLNNWKNHKGRFYISDYEQIANEIYKTKQNVGMYGK